MIPFSGVLGREVLAGDSERSGSKRVSSNSSISLYGLRDPPKVLLFLVALPVSLEDPYPYPNLEPVFVDVSRGRKKNHIGRNVGKQAHTMARDSSMFVQKNTGAV